MILMIDNYDSFVYNLVRYLRELEQDVLVIENDELTLEAIEKLNPAGIILSPGPKKPDDAGISLQVVEKLSGKIPIFGICLGHQVIGQAFGGQIVTGKEPVHGKVSDIYHNGEGIFNGLPSPLKATRYHSLIIDKASLPYELEITAETADGVIMGVRHKISGVHGVQFHPEAELTEYGHEMLANFIKDCYAK